MKIALKATHLWSPHFVVVSPLNTKLCTEIFLPLFYHVILVKHTTVKQRIIMVKQWILFSVRLGINLSKTNDWLRLNFEYHKEEHSDNIWELEEKQTMVKQISTTQIIVLPFLFYHNVVLRYVSWWHRKFSYHIYENPPITLCNTA